MRNEVYSMMGKKTQQKINEVASELLELLTERLPEVEDDGILGGMVLTRALEVYNDVLRYENTS